MVKIHNAIVIVALLGNMAQADHYPPQACQTPCYATPQMMCPPPCSNPAGEETGAPVGAFAPGPPAGEVAGASSSYGIRGFALRIPESVIRLPTLQLPSLIKYRKEPELLSDAGRIPYVNQPAAKVDIKRIQEGEPTGAPVNKTNCNQPYLPPCCPPYGCASNDLQQQRMEGLAQQIEQLNRAVAQLAAMQQSSGTLTSRPVTPVGLHGASNAAMFSGEPESPQAAQQRQLMEQFAQKRQELELLQLQIAAMQNQDPLMADQGVSNEAHSRRTEGVPSRSHSDRSQGAVTSLPNRLSPNPPQLASDSSIIQAYGETETLMERNLNGTAPIQQTAGVARINGEPQAEKGPTARSIFSLRR